jgi:SAM-dependent methyltransferase
MSDVHRREEYVTDVPYIRAFVGDLSPITLRLVAALNGFATSAGEEFDYCELGSAHGDTTATLAAAYPRARFVGVDINREHIASADALASAGGLDNVRFLERDFADLDGEQIPALDFVTAHGVLSWIGPAKRKALLDFASKKLKPGGLLYVSYNALPGWASVEPLRQLMLDRGAAVGGSSLARAREGLAFAKLLSESGAAYFTNNPAAKEMLSTMEAMGLPYIVHEYLHAHWVPMYFTQVAAEMAESDLYFVGELPLHLNYRDLAIPASLAPIFKTVSDRITFETLKDYATNQFFRRDVFVKGRIPRDETAATRWLELTPFGTLIGEGPLARNVRLPHHTLHFVGEVFDALLPTLAGGATTVDDLMRAPALSAFTRPRVRDALVRLALAGQVSPMVAPTRAGPPPAGPVQVTSAFNRMVLRERLVGDAPVVLASPQAGTGVPLPVVEAIAQRLLTEVPAPEWDAWLATFARRPTLRLFVGDRVVEDEADRARILRAQVEPFRTNRLPRLVELGIVTEAKVGTARTG